MGIYKETDQNRIVITDKLKVEKIENIGKYGISNRVDVDLIVRWMNEGVFEEENSFIDFVDNTYGEFCDWGNVVSNDGEGKALFARALVNLSTYFKKDEEGNYDCIVGSLYNGDLYIPNKYEAGVLYVTEINYYTRFGFITRTNNIDTNNHKLLENYKGILIEIDKKEHGILDEIFDKAKQGDIQDILNNNAKCTLVVAALLKTKDGYVLSRRGSKAIGSGNHTIMTGILGKEDLLGTLAEEIEEEFNVGNAIVNVENLGYSVVEQNFSGGRIVACNVVYEVELDITGEEFKKRYRDAVDIYENTDITIVETDHEGFKEHVSELYPQSAALETVVELI